MKADLLKWHDLCSGFRVRALPCFHPYNQIPPFHQLLTSFHFCALRSKPSWALLLFVNSSNLPAALFHLPDQGETLYLQSRKGLAEGDATLEDTPNAC